MATELVRLLRPLEAMMRWFDATGVRAAIIGGVAASLLGKPRLTKDIDAVVLDAEAEALIESGAPYGLLPRIADAVDFARNTRMVLGLFALAQFRLSTEVRVVRHFDGRRSRMVLRV